MANEKKISPQKAEEQKAYNEYVKEVTPTHSLPKNMAKAFLTGGLICVVGQGILQYCDSLGLDKDTAGSWCSLILVLLSVIFTGLNCDIWRRRGVSANYRICQFGIGAMYRV